MCVCVFMCVCVCVCVQACVCVCVCMHVHTCLVMCSHIHNVSIFRWYMCIYLSLSMCVGMYLNTLSLTCLYVIDLDILSHALISDGVHGNKLMVRKAKPEPNTSSTEVIGTETQYDNAQFEAGPVKKGTLDLCHEQS